MCGEEASLVRRRLVVWLVGSALLAAVTVLVGCAVSTSVTPVLPAKHVSYAAGTACDAAGCHTQYTHQEPYIGPCEGCHNLTDWKQVTYKHKDATFDNGMHPLVGCAMCHTEGQPLPSGGCGTCHDAPHGGWTSCGSCHITLAWRLFKPMPSVHLSLAGGHSKLVCLDCHDVPKTPVPARTCVNCHGENHGGLRNCEECHTLATGWKPKPGFSHDSFFKLVGAHKQLECGQCHQSGKFSGLPRVCVGCHGKKHGGLTDCASCHTTSSFKPSTFRHSRVFALTGRHAKLSCAKCHPRRQFARTIGTGGRSCVACHGKQHGGLTDCADCHTTKAFEPTTFRHSSVFPLVGGHVIACSQCHPDNKFAVVAGTRCSDCHATRHGNQTQCQNCHNSGVIPLKQISHPAENVPLGVAHARLDRCGRCHVGIVFNTPTQPCVNCHAGDLPHVGPTDCFSCHRATTWDDIHFTHPPIPNFENTGPSGHESTDFGPYPNGCAECHVGTGPPPNFTAVSCIAAGCHQ